MKKILTILLSVILVLASVNVDAYAATKKLQNPTNLSVYWSGEYLCLTWDKVSYAGKYEVKIGNKTYNPPSNRFFIHRSFFEKVGNKYKLPFEIRAVATDKNHVSSESRSYTINTPIVDTSSASNLSEATFLAKDDLVKYLKANGYSPTVSEEGDCILVSIAIKDKNNSGFVPFLKDVFDGATKEGAGNVKENATDIAVDALSEGEGIKGKFKKGIDGIIEYAEEGVVVGGLKGAYNHIVKDKNTHIIYYYVKGNEKFAASVMEYNYLVKNNKTPTEVLKNWKKVNNNEVYSQYYPDFSDTIISTYDVSGSNDSSRYSIYFFPNNNKYITSD